MNIKISIITIVYNGASVIEKTIQSVLNQNYLNLEYIIIDGGSVDGTQKIIENYKSQLSYFLSEKDRGISDAFNKGISFANGDLIGLINAGDILAPNVLDIIAKKYSEEYNKHEFYVLHGNIQMSLNNGKVYKPFELQTFSYQMAIWHPTAFVSRNVYEKFHYNINYKIAMDYELFCQLYRQGANFKYIDKILVYMDTNGLSNKNAILGFKEVMKASQKNLNIPYFISILNFYRRCILFYLNKIKKCLV
jgi:glycosyltransferase involved in cell wall biosynthesis